MDRWDDFARGRAGLAAALLGVIALPVVGVVMLRYLLSQPAPPAVERVPAIVNPAGSAASTGPTAAASLPTPLATAAATPPATPTPVPTPTATPAPLGVVNATDGLNVRSEPSTRGQILRILPHQTEVQLTGRERQAEGLSWAELDEGGWVQVRYLDR